MYIVTVKLPRNPGHDPRTKVTGPCPINPQVVCTDVTGEHHSALANNELLAALSAQGIHITRIESLG